MERQNPSDLLQTKFELCALFVKKNSTLWSIQMYLNWKQTAATYVGSILLSMIVELPK